MATDLFIPSLIVIALSLSPYQVDSCGPYGGHYGRPCMGAMCGPGPLGMGLGGFYPDPPFRALQSVLGGNIRMDGKLKEGSASSSKHHSRSEKKTVITSSKDLDCTEWDDHCHWRNRGHDKLEWYRGSGSPDLFRLKLSTGSVAPPTPPFAIVATNKALPKAQSASLTSDPVPCQAGDGEVRFTYWTTPQVRLTLCTKKLSTEGYDYCSQSVTGGDPGPAVIRIPGSLTEPFEISITADNFVYNDGRYSGGFAMIDDLHYTAELCQDPEMPRAPENDHGIEDRKRSFLGPTDPLDEIRYTTIRYTTVGHDDTEACRSIKCDFHDGPCMDYVMHSDFKVHKGQLERIPGDASRDPFNPNGEFAYAVGPLNTARLTLPSFTLQESRVLRFAYYRPTAETKLTAVVARSGDDADQVVFQTPDSGKDIDRWVQEAVSMHAGKYEKVSFEAPNLGKDTYIGIDEIRITDARNRSIC